MAEQRVQRRLAAILAADVVGYSRLMRADETGTLAQLKTLRKEVFDPRTAEHNGRIVKTTGDGVLVEFASAVDAVQCAIEVQQALGRRNADVPADRRIELRFGINLGDIIVDGDDIYGDGVNVAARLEALCDPGEVYVAAAIRDQVEGKIDAAFEDLGEHTVKNIDTPIGVYRVSLEPVSAGAVTVASEPKKLFQRPAVAVLPFENIGGDPEQEYFADGLTEDIITALSLWRTFPVIARNSTFAFKGHSKDIREIGLELGARYVLEGSVRRGANRVRVTAQLIDAETGHHMWAERYDRDMTDIFEVQDEITHRIAAIVQPALESVEQLRSATQPPANLNAWDYYQRGMFHHYEFTRDGNINARSMFERAIVLDPNYSRAYAGLAYTHYRDLYLGFSESPEESTVKGFDAARQAIALDDDDPRGYQMLALIYMRMGQFDRSIAQSNIAVRLNPSDTTWYATIGHALDCKGRPEESFPFWEEVFEYHSKDPRIHLWMKYCAQAYLHAGNYSEAIVWAENAISRRPEFLEAHVILSASLGHAGEDARARSAIEECARIDPAFGVTWTGWWPYRPAEQIEHVAEGLRKAGWEG